MRTGVSGTTLLVPQAGQSTVLIAPVRAGSATNSIFRRALHPAHTYSEETVLLKRNKSS